MVTGAARGVGRALFYRASARGRECCPKRFSDGCGLARARQAVAELGRRAGAIAAYNCTALDALANQAFAESGAIDVLVNGAASPESIAFLDLKRATFEKIFESMWKFASPHSLRVEKSGRYCGQDAGLLDDRGQHNGYLSREESLAIIARKTKMSASRTWRITRLAYLAPDLVRAIASGDAPPALTIDRLMRVDLPLSWAAQRALFAPHRP
jgi:NAD(P)-dependent dehydrogenase (short-subunit alcohol dehydrogenase family)